MFFLLLGILLFVIAFITGIAGSRVIAFGFISFGVLFLAIGGMILSGSFTG